MTEELVPQKDNTNLIIVIIVMVVIVLFIGIFYGGFFNTEKDISNNKNCEISAGERCTLDNLDCCKDNYIYTCVKHGWLDSRLLISELDKDSSGAITIYQIDGDNGDKIDYTELGDACGWIDERGGLGAKREGATYEGVHEIYCKEDYVIIPKSDSRNSPGSLNQRLVGSSVIACDTGQVCSQDVNNPVACVTKV